MKKKYKKPFKPIYFIFRVLVYPFINHKYNVHSDLSKIKEIKPPFIVLANHGTGLGPVFLIGTMKHIYMSPVGGYAYFKNKKMSWFLKLMRAIPKFQYQTDLKAMKDMINVTKNGGVLALFPTGRNSSCGEGFPIPDSLAKLIKLSKVKVVLCKISGSYLTKPKWAISHRKGRIDIDYSLLFDENHVKELDVETMTSIINEKLDFNEYEWNRKQNIEFKGKKLAENLDNILYRCPNCGKEFYMKSKDNCLYCNSCGTKFILKTNGFFEENTYFEYPLQYYEWQRDSVNKLISSSFELSDNVKCKMCLEKGITPVGEGKIVLTNDKILYKGTILGEEKEIVFDILSLFSLPYKAGVNIELADEKDIYQFEFENRYLPTKFCLIIEELYKRNKG